MIKVYDDGSVYVGEMKDGQRCGKGSYYILSDFFAGSKTSGNWENDKLNGWSQISTVTSCLSGAYKDGVKNGLFLRDHKDGRRYAITYKDDINMSDEMYSNGHNSQSGYLGCVGIGENTYFIGDVYSNEPFGYGVIYVANENKKIINKYFCEMYGRRLVQSIDISEMGQECRLI